jgi:L-fuculose-phosphate aldolase
MLLEQERIDVVKYCKKLITAGLTTGTGGNISILNREKGLYAMSPSGMDYFETQPEDVVVMDLDGNVVDGKRKPSSEHALHRIFYTDRDDLDAIVQLPDRFCRAGNPLRRIRLLRHAGARQSDL